MRKVDYKIGFGVPEIINEKAISYVVNALRNQRLSYGPYCKKFEDEMARLHNAKFGIVSNSGTSSLRVAIACMKELHGWEDGDEIITPSSTFVATSNVIIMHNLKPVFVDVDRNYYCIDPEKIEERITKKTRAIMVVHHYGQPADMDPILEIAKKHNLKVIEDSCETMFVKYNGRPVGTLGDIGCFSIYACHIITGGVGGLCLTNNEDYAKVIRSLCNHGRNEAYISIDDDRDMTDSELHAIIPKRFRFERLGYSYRITEMEAAIACAQLEDWEGILRKRQENAMFFNERLAKYNHKIQLPKVRPGSSHSFMMYPIVIKDPRINKEDLVNFLEDHNIITRNMNPLMQQPIYLKLFGNLYEKFPITKWIDRNGFYIGCHQQLTDEEREYMVGVFDAFFAKEDYT